MNDILDDLRKAKANAMKGQDAGTQLLLTRAIDEIESLRNQFFDGVTRILATAKETNAIVKDANDRLDRAGVPRGPST